MVNLVERLFGSFVSAITSYCFFQYNHPHPHPHNYQGTNNKHNMTKARPISLQTVELKVRMCCSGCERVIKDAVFKLRGVESVSVELEMEKVTVVGYVERNKVLKAVRRHGKRAEFWPYPNPPLYFTSSSNYFKDMTSEYRDSYNYWRHGYNVADKHGTLHVTHRGDDKVSNLFNDDNVNACCLM